MGETWLTVDMWGFLSVHSTPVPGKYPRDKMGEKFIDNIMPVSSVVCYNLNLNTAVEFPRLSVLLLLCPE